MTEARPFQPLHARLASLPADETLYDGVPGWLGRSLREWLDKATRGLESLAGRVVMRLRLPLEDSQQTYRTRLLACPPMDLLTVVDAVLQLHPGWAWPLVDPWDHTATREYFLRSLLCELDDILTDAGSLYRPDSNTRCLVRRVDPTVQAAADKAVAASPPTAAGHLRAAWTAAYGLSPDPDRAYREAVLAVEALACPLVAPRSNKATLGMVISNLGDQTARWELAVGDTATGQPAGIGPLVEMLRLLWKGHFRHAGGPTSRRQTQGEAEAAVHLAATLVHWLSTGVLRRR